MVKGKVKSKLLMASHALLGSAVEFTLYYTGKNVQILNPLLKLILFMLLLAKISNQKL